MPASSLRCRQACQRIAHSLVKAVAAPPLVCKPLEGKSIRQQIVHSGADCRHTKYSAAGAVSSPAARH